MTGFDGSNAVAILEALTAATGFVNAIGIETDAEHTNADRVVWIPRARRHKNVTQQPAGGKACKTKVWLFDVAIYAADFARADERLDAVIVGLDLLLSLNAYDTVGDAIPRGGNLGASGFGLTQQIVISGPVYEVRYGAIVVADFVGEGSIKDPDGTTEEFQNG